MKLQFAPDFDSKNNILTINTVQIPPRSGN